MGIDYNQLRGTGAFGTIETIQAGYGPKVQVSVSTNGGTEWATRAVNGDDDGDEAHSDTNGVTAHFEYHPTFLLGNLSPQAGPAVGGTLVTVSLASTVTAYDTTGTLGSLRNASAPSAWQFAFDPVRDAGAKCLFNGTSVAATVVSNSSVECVAPPTDPGGGVSFVRVSLNGIDVFDYASYGSGSYLRFLYLPDEEEMLLFPASGPVKGGTLVEISSRHIAKAATLLLSETMGKMDNVQASVPFISNISNTLRFPLSSVVCSFGGFTTLASGISLPRRGLSDFEERDTDVGRVLCVSPPAADYIPSRVSVEISLNGGNDFTQYEAQFHYRPEAHISGLEPTYGPVTGGNAVRVEGGPFRDEGTGGKISEQILRCRFGDKEVGATMHTTRLVSCRAPPLASVPEEQDVEV